MAAMLISDPLTQLSFSVYENRGVFALLIGSGLSRAAEIPTGWEITLFVAWQRRRVTRNLTGRTGMWRKQVRHPTILSSLRRSPRRLTSADFAQLHRALGG